jgi:tRNA(Ile)-lysidine synthase
MPRARCCVEARLLEALASEGLKPGDALAVAYSGGPDSAALLTALTSIGWGRPIAIYVDHGIRPRGELELELELVRRTCAALGARLTVARIASGTIANRAKSSGLGIEAEARRYRYAALRSAAGQRSAKAVLLAHTMDDQLETILMRLMGGSGSEGVKGIPRASGIFFRPFLSLGKPQLIAYLRDRGIAYSTDSTNAAGDYLRNRVRGDLVPILDRVFPGWRRGLTRSAALAALSAEAIAAAADAIAFVPGADGSASLVAGEDQLLAAPCAVAVRAIVRAAGRLLSRERFPEAAAEAALEAIRRGKGSIYRGAGIEMARKPDGTVSIKPACARKRGGLDFPCADGYFVLIDRPRRVRVGKLEVSAFWLADPRPAGERPGIRADAFRFPLVVRSRRPGDAIALQRGTKRLDALFSEWGLPEGDRGSVPVVEDRDGIVAVLAAGLGGKDRFRAHPQDGGARCLSVIVKGA